MCLCVARPAGLSLAVPALVHAVVCLVSDGSKGTRVREERCRQRPLGDRGVHSTSYKCAQISCLVMDRSYLGENRPSHQHWARKHQWARSVVRWGTTCEPLVTICLALLHAATPAPHVRRPARAAPQPQRIQGTLARHCTPRGASRAHRARGRAGCLLGVRRGEVVPWQGPARFTAAGVSSFC